MTAYKKGKGIMYIALGIIIGLIAAGFGGIYYQNSHPNIEIGLDNGQLREIPESPNCVSTETAQKDKLVEPMPFKSSLEATKTALKTTFEAYGGIEIKNETDTYIYAVATTSLMRFHDDIEVCFDTEAQVIRFRSASRAGYSDMGLNKERYDAFVDLYGQQPE